MQTKCQGATSSSLDQIHSDHKSRARTLQAYLTSAVLALAYTIIWPNTTCHVLSRCLNSVTFAKTPDPSTCLPRCAPIPCHHTGRQAFILTSLCMPWSHRRHCMLRNSVTEHPAESYSMHTCISSCVPACRYVMACHLACARRMCLRKAAQCMNACFDLDQTSYQFSLQR